MSWMAKLYETYEAIFKNPLLEKAVEPYYHKKERCHIEIIIDEGGNFISAVPLVEEVIYGRQKFWKGSDTIIPVTPKSLSGRTSGPAPYPLAEQIQYIAKDYPDFGGTKTSYFNEFFELISTWANDERFSHYKVQSILKYVAKGTVVQDLLRLGLLYGYKKDRQICLIDKWDKQGPNLESGEGKLPKPPLLKAVSSGKQGNAKVRWRVQQAGEPNDATWGDRELITSWQDFQEKENRPNGFCQILCEEKYLAAAHSKGIVPKANDAKIISTPTDKSYLTYQGRFTNEYQPCSISFEVSQKAHNALRWLIQNQGYQNDTQVYVCWAVSSKAIPDPLKSSLELFTTDFALIQDDDFEPEDKIDHGVDLGESFAHRFNKYLQGYWQREKLTPNDQIIVMGFDAATKGRMGILYYRVLLASEFMQRINAWHQEFAWPQRHTLERPDPSGKKKPDRKTIWRVSSPAPRLIAEVAYGNILKSNDSLKKSVLERILPCIVDGMPFPKGLVGLAVRRTCNRAVKRLPEKLSNNKSEKSAWEKDLGVACALYKGFYLRHPVESERRTYRMALEEDRTTRDYLYGRLLAIAERIEETALRIGGEERPTTAARLMQRFADRPFSTWRNIELALQPYMQRLQGNRAGFLVNRKKELDAVQALFFPDDFTSDKPLSGEFLLGYHCQRQAGLSKTSGAKVDKEENHES